MSFGRSAEKLANGVADDVVASWPKVRRDVEALGRDISRVGEKHFSESQAAVSEEISKLRDGLSDLLTKLSDRAQPQIDEALDVVRRRPVAALASVFAIGIVTAALLSRRRS